MKVIFLDVDGVLNTQFTFSDISHEIMFGYGRRIEIEDDKVEYVKRIIDATGAVVVLSSTWRCFFYRNNDVVLPFYEKGFQLMEKLNNHGINIYDLTGYDPNRNRENEIREYVESHGITDFVILDDDMSDEIGLYCDRTIQTRFSGFYRDKLGLREKHIDKAIDILNRKVLIKK